MIKNKKQKNIAPILLVVSLFSMASAKEVHCLIHEIKEDSYLIATQTKNKVVINSANKKQTEQYKSICKEKNSTIKTKTKVKL